MNDNQLKAIEKTCTGIFETFDWPINDIRREAEVKLELARLLAAVAKQQSQEK